MTPDDHTIQETFLDAGNGHEVYIHEWGNSKATTPILFLHGGPGGGCSDGHKQYFDPLQHRVIFFDQRGCGRSLPRGSLEHNTTQDLIEDIEKIAKKFDLASFVLCGGSWGSTLALLYALSHPQRVAAMVLHGIFTSTQAEIDYFDRGEFRAFFPEAWQRYLDKTPESHRNNPTRYHYTQILGTDHLAAKESAYAYESMEGALLGLDDRYRPQSDLETYDATDVRIEVHYLAHGCFLPDRHILNNAHKLTMPIWIVQGRYDFVCPPITAYTLHTMLPHSQLIWTIAGHKGSDRAKYDVIHSILLQFGS